MTRMWIAGIGAVVLAAAGGAGVLAWRGRAPRTAPATTEAAPAQRLTQYDRLPRVLARIGETEITKEELRASIKDGVADGAPDSDETRKTYQLVVYMTTRSTVMHRVLHAEARRQGLTLDADE